MVIEAAVKVFPRESNNHSFEFSPKMNCSNHFIALGQDHDLKQMC